MDGQMTKRNLLIAGSVTRNHKARRAHSHIGEETALSEFFAVAFGKDGMAGDSSYACDQAVPCSVDSTFEEILDTWIKVQSDELENCFGDDRPVGFWILTAKGLGVVKSTVRECNNDSAAYAQNRQGKALVKKLAVKVVGDPSALNGGP
jgi:hypothetical protein